MLTNEQVNELKKLIAKKTPITKIAKMFGTSRQNIYNLCNSYDIPYGKNNFYLTVNETYKGIPYKEYCKQYHIAPEKVRSLMKYENYTLVDAIDKLRSEKSKYTIDGVPAWKLAQRNGVSYRTFWTRIAKGKSLEDAIKPLTYNTQNGYKKNMARLITGLNDKKNIYFDYFALFMNDIQKNVKTEFKTIRDCEDFLKSISVPAYKENQLYDFWNYFKRLKSFNFSEAWVKYTEDPKKIKLWNLEK